MSRTQQTQNLEREQERRRHREQARMDAQTLHDSTPHHRSKEHINDSQRRIKSGNRMLMLVLFAVIVLCLLTTLMLGVGVYRNLVTHGNEQQQLRLETSLMSNSIRQLDNVNALRTGEGPEGPALVIAEDVDGEEFETRFYASEGWLVQEYTLASAPYTPEFASQIAQTETFAFELRGQLIEITTDAGTSYVSMRSSQGGEQ